MGKRVVGDQTAASFFHEQLLSAMSHQRVSTSPFTECYVVHLLTGFASGEALPARESGFAETPLALLYARALQASGWERAELLRGTADTALFVSGFFAGSLPRGEGSLRYYATLGRQAYARLGSALERDARVATRVFTELAGRFREFVDLLTEVSERTMVNTPLSLLRLYERWRETGSPRAAALLAQKGLTPALADEGVLH
jgi:hypothetical protein